MRWNRWDWVNIKEWRTYDASSSTSRLSIRCSIRLVGEWLTGICNQSRCAREGLQLAWRCLKIQNSLSRGLHHRLLHLLQHPLRRTATKTVRTSSEHFEPCHHGFWPSTGLFSFVIILEALRTATRPGWRAMIEVWENNCFWFGHLGYNGVYPDISGFQTRVEVT